MSRNAQRSQNIVSDRFNANDADVQVKSADKIIFKLHRTNIEVQTGAFPSSLSEPLSERAHVLEILFQFLYPQNHPKLTNMLFERVLEVATAAEKYKIFAAMNVSQVRLREFLPLHATKILSYAIQFDHISLINETALLVARSPVYDVLLHLPSPETLIPWARYHEAWDTIFDHAMHILEFKSNGNVLPTYHKCTSAIAPVVWICKKCQQSLIAWIDRLKRIDNLPVLVRAVDNPDFSGSERRSRCESCRGDQCEYLQRTRKVIEKGIRIMNDSPFVGFLKGNSELGENLFTKAIASIKSSDGGILDGEGCTIV